MMLQRVVNGIECLDEKAMARAKERLDNILKPPGSLGKLEEHMIRIAGIRSGEPETSPKAIAVFCADNGVVAQGVAGFDSSLTAIMAEYLAKGETSVCRMASVAGAAVYPVDIGISSEIQAEGLLNRRIAGGTKDFSREHAMSRQEALSALEVGIDFAGELADKGYRLLAAGEMGIGNTTSSAAVAAAVLRLPADRVTGRGAGLSDEALERKTDLIHKALTRWQPDPEDPVDILCKVGGLDLAGMAGFYLGAAFHRLPVVLDGVISGAAALLACGLCPGTKDYLLASHVSTEPAGSLILDYLGLSPLLTAGMRLGEGTGAVASFPLYDMMQELYDNMLSFSDLAGRATV